MSKDIKVTFKGTECCNLPGSDYWVTAEGTLLSVTTLVPYKARPVYRVTRKGTRRYYTREDLVKLYEKFYKK
jgi:hypothetical protein